MSCCTEEKFWAEDLCDLFCNLSIIPKASMSLDSKLNALTRLVIIISIIAYFLGLDFAAALVLCGLCGVASITFSVASRRATVSSSE